MRNVWLADDQRARAPALEWARSSYVVYTGLAWSATAAGMDFAAPAQGIDFGPNMTSLTFDFTRSVGRTLRPGNRVVGTELDHDANITPWTLACEDAGAEHVLAPLDATSGRLVPDSVINLIDERTRWVAVNRRVEPTRHDHEPAAHYRSGSRQSILPRWAPMCWR